MPRNRVIYQVDNLFVGPTGAYPSTGALYINIPSSVGNAYGQPFLQAASGQQSIAELFRIQSANYSFNKTLKDVNQFGELAAIDRVPLEQPTVSLDFTYLLANFINEKRFGFNMSSGTPVSCISGILNGSTDQKNYFIQTVPEGNDGVGYNSLTNNVTAIGNGFISSYSSQGSVGNFPTVTVNIEGLNMEVESVSSGAANPSVFPVDGTQISGWVYQIPTGVTQNISGNAVNTLDNTLSVLRPGDITFSLGLNAGDGFYTESDLKVQNYNLSFNLSRQNLSKIGSKYAFAKVINFPVQATLAVTADVGDLQTGSLIEIVSNNNTFNPKITLKKPGSSTVICAYTLLGAKLDSQSTSSSIGSNRSVTMNFSTQIAGPQSTTNGVICSGLAEVPFAII